MGNSESGWSAERWTGLLMLLNELRGTVLLVYHLNDREAWEGSELRAQRDASQP